MYVLKFIFSYCMLNYFPSEDETTNLIFLRNKNKLIGNNTNNFYFYFSLLIKLILF